MFSRHFACAALLLAATGVSQSSQEGYQVWQRNLPAGASQPLVLSDGSFAWFDGQQIHHEPVNGPSTVLLDLGVSVFGSFLIEVDNGVLLFGESLNQEIWRVPVAGGAQMLNTLTFNFSATAYSSTHAVISAKTGGFSSPDNEVHAIDLVTGQTDLLATIPGASGPVVADASGNLFYATASNAFPSPPGAVDILRFDAATLQSAFGATSLDETDAVTLLAGLDAAGSIALDNDGDLFIADWANSQLVEIDDAAGGSATSKVLVDYSSTFLSMGSLQFLPGAIANSGSVFEPFQPAFGGSLVISETDFGSISRLRTLTPQRATVSVPSSVPAGAFSIVTAGGPAGGTGVMAWDAGANVSTEAPFAVGFEQPFFWSLLSAPVAVPVAFDGNGINTLALTNPGLGSAVDFAVQVLFVDAGASVVGSTAAVTFTVQ